MDDTNRSPKPNEASLRRTLRSFRFALAGIGYLARTQPNFRVHLVAAGLVVVLATVLEAGPGELALLVLAIGLVLVAEAMNTAIEAVVDLASPDVHLLARIAKDGAAAGVLLAAIVAAVVGLVVLGPRLALRLFG